MRILIGAGIAFIACSSFIGVAHGADSAKCERLYKDFVTEDKNIAQIYVSSLSDDSAPRETNRQMKILVSSINKSNTLQLMAAARCNRLPDTADASADYQLAAHKCLTERRSVTYVSDKVIALCNMDAWQPSATRVLEDRDDGVRRNPDSSCQVPPCYAQMQPGK